MLARPPVSLNAALAVPFILSGNDLNTIAKLLLEALKYLKAFVCGTVINAKENKIFRPIFDLMKPLGDYFAHGSLFVVNRHDDGEFGRVHGLRLWRQKEHF